MRILARINTQAVLRSISLDNSYARSEEGNAPLSTSVTTQQPSLARGDSKAWEYLLHGFGDAGTRDGTQFGGCVPQTGVRAARIVVAFQGTPLRGIKRQHGL